METKETLITLASNSEHNGIMLDMWNAFCNSANYPDDVIYNMSDAPAIFGDTTELMNAVKRGKADLNHAYFRLNGDAMLSFNEMNSQNSNSPIDFDLLSKWLDNNNDYLGYEYYFDLPEDDEE